MRLITLAIHTYDRALALRQILEAEGIEVTLQNVNLNNPEVSTGVRVRINESDLALALRIVENPEIFRPDDHKAFEKSFVKHILVPVDFSAHSQNAVEVAVRLAASQKSDISFIHSYIDPRLSGEASLSNKLTFELVETEDSLAASSTANSRMKQFADSLRMKMKEGTAEMTRFSTDVLEGVPEDVINKYAREHIPSLIVMGTRTAVQKDSEMIGSVTAQVLDDCRFPVLSIPANFVGKDFRSPSNILFFSNLDQEDILAMDTLYRFFPSSNPEVTIIHIPERNRYSDYQSDKSAMNLSDYCSKTFSHFSFRSVPLSRKNISEELKSLQTEKKFDMLVVPSRRKNAFSRFFNPGLPYRILFQTDIPMLVIPV